MHVGDLGHSLLSFAMQEAGRCWSILRSCTCVAYAIVQIVGPDVTAWHVSAMLRQGWTLPGLKVMSLSLQRWQDRLQEVRGQHR